MIKQEFPWFPWAADTAQDTERWTLQNPATGHCAVASLIVQDLFGGELWRLNVDGAGHYFNRLASGALLDATASQFERPLNYADAEWRSREYVLSHPSTVTRYELLKSRMQANGQTSHCPKGGNKMTAVNQPTCGYVFDDGSVCGDVRDALPHNNTDGELANLKLANHPFTPVETVTPPKEPMGQVCECGAEWQFHAGGRACPPREFTPPKEKCGALFAEDGGDLEGTSRSVCENTKPCQNEHADAPKEDHEQRCTCGHRCPTREERAEGWECVHAPTCKLADAQPPKEPDDSFRASRPDETVESPYVNASLRRGISKMGWTPWWLVDCDGRLLNTEPVCSTPDKWHPWFEAHLTTVTTPYIGLTDRASPASTTGPTGGNKTAGLQEESQERPLPCSITSTIDGEGADVWLYQAVRIATFRGEDGVTEAFKMRYLINAEAETWAEVTAREPVDTLQAVLDVLRTGAGGGAWLDSRYIGCADCCLKPQLAKALKAKRESPQPTTRQRGGEK